MPAKHFLLFHLLILLLKVINNFNHISSLFKYSDMKAASLHDKLKQIACLVFPSLGLLLPFRHKLIMNRWVESICVKPLQGVQTLVCTIIFLQKKRIKKSILKRLSDYFVSPFSGWPSELSYDSGHVVLSLTSSKRICYLVKTGAGQNLCGTGRWKARYRNGHNSIGRHSRSWGGKIELCSNLTT